MGLPIWKSIGLTALAYTETDSGAWQLMGKPDVLAPVVPADLLARQPPADGGLWGIHRVNSSSNVMTLADAFSSLSGSAGTHSYHWSPTLNFIDPDYPGQSGIFGSDKAVPGDNAGSNDENFAIHAKAILNIATEGYYTFANRSGDGAMLRIRGRTLAKS